MAVKFHSIELSYLNLGTMDTAEYTQPPTEVFRPYICLYCQIFGTVTVPCIH